MMGRRMTCHFYLNLVLSFAFGPFHFHTLFRLYIYFLKLQSVISNHDSCQLFDTIDELF